MQFINIGFGNLISAQRLIAVVSPDSAPVKRLVQESRDRGMLIDATYGRSADHGQRPCGAVRTGGGAAGTPSGHDGGRHD